MFNITQVGQVPAGIAAVDFLVSVKGSVMTINGSEFDFSFMEKGESLPFDAMEDENGDRSPYFVEQDVTCDESGVINVSLYVPVQDPRIPLPVLQNKKLGKVIDIHIAAIELPEVVKDADQ